MKKIFTLIVSCFVLTALFAQEVPRTQKIMVTKIAATWCPPCGGEAWDNFNTLLVKHNSSAIFLTAHLSSSSMLYSRTSEDLATNLPQVFGQPLFYGNRTKLSTGGVVADVDKLVSDLKGKTAKANVGIQMNLEKDILKVKAKAQFFEATSGDYYLSLYVIEDHVQAEQANRGDNVAHSKILRTSLTNQVFGEAIASGSIAKDKTFTLSLNKAIDPKWNTKNLEIAGVIWKKVGTEFDFININSTKEFTAFTAVNLLEKAGVSFNVQPTILHEQAVVEVTAPSVQKNVQINLLNTNGQIVQTIFTGDLTTGTQRFALQSKATLSKGLYFISLQNKEGHAITQKVIVP